MKTRITLASAAMLMFFALTNAHSAEVIWVVQDEGPAGEEFVEMLRTEGLDVTVMVVAGAPPDASQQAAMNGADLVIVSRKVNSGDAAYNTLVWNDTITSPLISATPYILRTMDDERWRWLQGVTVIDETPSTVLANDATHKVLEGIPLIGDVSPPWHFAIDRNTTVSTDPLAGGGRLIATKTAGPAGGILVAEWDAGQVALGPRMMFMMGSREPAGQPDIGDSYGRFNLTEYGQIAYLNAISYYAGPWGAAHLFTPASKDLGEVDSAPGGQDVSILVKNIGVDLPVNILGITFTGPGKDLYSVRSAPAALAPTETAEIVINLDAQGQTGAFDADMIIENDSTLESLRNRKVSLSARAFNFAGPGAHYTLDESEGVEIRDITGFDRHAVLSGDAALGAESLFLDEVNGGTAVSFAGGQITADLSTMAALVDFSVSLWINVEPGEAELQTLFARDDGGSPAFALLLSGVSELQWFVGSEAVYQTSSQPVTSGVNHHITVVYEKSKDETLNLYLDGELLESVSGLPGFDDDPSLPFYMGSFGGVFSYFGKVDDIQIYDRALSAADVEFLFNNPPLPIQPALPDVTSPEDPILIVNGTDDGDGEAGEPPASEGVVNAINNTAQKYLNFLDLGSGFIVTPVMGPTEISGARFYPANDSVERDPASYEIWGSTAGAGGPFELIASGDLSLPDERNPAGGTPVDYRTLVHQEIAFDNETVYVSYQVVFPTLKDAATANSMQIGEVELLGAPGFLPPSGPTAVWVSSALSEAGEEFLELLRAEGFHVIEMTVGSPSAEEQAILNSADVVIVSRKVNSVDFNNAIWDEQITAPLILMSAYLSRANRWAWLNQDELVDITPSAIVVEEPGHPVFEGLSIVAGMTAGWHVAVDRGTSAPAPEVPMANGGRVIASGDGSVIVAEWDEGAVAAGKRMLFLAGSREADGAGIDTAGAYDLTADGEIAFLSAVRYFAGIEPSGDPPPVLRDVVWTGDSFRFGFTGNPGKTYDILWSLDLTGWSTIETGLTGEVVFTDSDAERLAAPSGYYRALER
ncbi:MAG TPA: LamG domain-containing protein [Verrucomicrobiales bacterium]|nr:LamG domain-containing protein [Verrucomicrobiales bacterium]